MCWVEINHSVYKSTLSIVSLCYRRKKMRGKINVSARGGASFHVFFFVLMLWWPTPGLNLNSCKALWCTCSIRLGHLNLQIYEGLTLIAFHIFWNSMLLYCLSLCLTTLSVMERFGQLCSRINPRPGKPDGLLLTPDPLRFTHTPYRSSNRVGHKTLSELVLGAWNVSDA